MPIGRAFSVICSAGLLTATGPQSPVFQPLSASEEHSGEEAEQQRGDHGEQEE